MKRLLAFLLCMFVLTTCFTLFVHADMDEGDFDGWYVVCGPAGYRFKDHLFDDRSDTPSMYWENLIPGTKLRVQEYDFETKEYMLVISDNDLGSRYKGTGIVYVSESQLDKYFSGEKKPVRKTYGEELKKEVKCVVTPKVGLMLRQGPNENYPAYRTIPYNTELTYKYLCKTDKYNWAYVTYKGQAGWCSIDYTKAIEPTTETTTETTTEITTETTTETTTVTTAAPTTEATTEPTTAPMSEPLREEPIPEEATDFFSNTTAVIIVCCLGALVLALTAVVILLIVKRKKNS